MVPHAITSKLPQGHATQMLLRMTPQTPPVLPKRLACAYVARVYDPHSPGILPLLGSHSDGTTTMVILIGELMKQAERYMADGLHPRIIAEVRCQRCGEPADRRSFPLG